MPSGPGTIHVHGEIGIIARRRTNGLRYGRPQHVVVIQIPRHAGTWHEFEARVVVVLQLRAHGQIEPFCTNAISSCTNESKS